jgi:hypothetical protein
MLEGKRYYAGGLSSGATAPDQQTIFTGSVRPADQTKSDVGQFAEIA